MAPTEILTRRPEVTFGTAGVQPPAAFYVDRNDRFRVIVHNSVSSLVVGLRGRFLSPKGEMQTINEEFTPTSDRVASTSILNLGEGFLLDLAIIQSASGVDVRRGQCFIQVRRHRGSGTEIMTGVLLADYLTGSGPVAFPGARQLSSVEGPGVMRVITGTDPAAGAEVSETVPTNARWRLIAARIPLVTDATATNRIVVIVFDDGTTEFYRGSSTFTQTASLGRTYDLSGLSIEKGSVVDRIQIAVPLPINLLQGFRFRTVTSAFQAGDNWQAPILLVEEWIEE